MVQSKMYCCVGTCWFTVHLNSYVIGVSVIQGDSGGICNTLGNDNMCDSKQKSSYKHVSDFQRLRSYDRLKLRIEGNDY
jgi:hypothetical protein